MSYSDLARATGFGRGFPGDVISGRRRLTARSFYAFQNALKLPLPGKKMFRFLVACEEPDLFPGLDPQTAAQSVAELRAIPWNRPRRESHEREVPGINGILSDPDSLALFAATGLPGKGASFAEIKSRTRLADPNIEKGLLALERAGLIRFQNNVYKSQDLHLSLTSSARNEVFTLLFREACRNAAERANQASVADREMFFTSTFCIDEVRLPELKAALRATLLKFVDDSIHAEGDRIVHLVTGMHF